MGTKVKKKIHVIYRAVEICPHCGGWDPFRKGRNGTSVTDQRGLRRVYGHCVHCGVKLTVQYVAQENFEAKFHENYPNGGIKK